MTFRLFGKLVRLLLKERMEYRGDFILSIFSQIVAYAGDYIVIWLFIKKFNTIAGWTWPEIAFLYSLGLITYALGASFSFVQMRELENQVKKGTFDSLLIKPVNPYFYVISRGFNLAYIAHISISGCVLIWAMIELNMNWTISDYLYLILVIISGAMIQAGILTVIGAFSFIWVRTNFMFTLFFRLKDFISYPLPIFGTFIQILLTVVIPLAFVNYYPASYLMSHDTVMLPIWAKWFVPLVGLLCYWAGYRFWMFGANKYQGAGG
ncbi:ABC transporter permease [Paenibacillus camelliae]|uniref:ABC transporter permease n=1 Tax=Paenibacillus camelliae TaxID=512410 RepID=UPI002040A1AE|nr:ABC transporter permease [Paenibacillus camelliae]